MAGIKKIDERYQMFHYFIKWNLNIILYLSLIYPFGYVILIFSKIIHHPQKFKFSIQGGALIYNGGIHL